MIYLRDRTLARCGYDRPSSFFLSPSISSNDLSRLFPLYIAIGNRARLTTYLPVRPLFSYFLPHTNSPRLSLSLPITLSLHEIINITVRCRYLHNLVDSISGLSRTEGNQIELNRARRSDREYSGFYFLRPGVRERERSSGRFHRGGRCRVYVDL